MANETMTHDELVELLGELFDDNSIGCYGETRTSGYGGLCTCPSCLEIRELTYESNSTEHMLAISNHRDTCRLNRLYNYVSEHRK